MCVKLPVTKIFIHQIYDSIRYDRRCYFNVRSKANISQLNLPHDMFTGHDQHHDLMAAANKTAGAQSDHAL